jgi:hypothetical protein
LTSQNISLGIQVLESRGLFHEDYFYWIGLGSLIGFTVLFNLGYTLALTYLNRMYHSRKYDRLCILRLYFHEESEIVMDFDKSDGDVLYLSNYLMKYL